jgi:hypothetical protein
VGCKCLQSSTPLLLTRHQNITTPQLSAAAACRRLWST